MLDLVRKRHEGDGWLVFSEVGNKPGMYANRHADALALGVWASTKYEAHLYEFKISREDLKRELRDPTKAEAVGSYCTYWWLVVSDEKVIADLVIPDVWGILIPTVRGGSKILKVHRKGTKLTPKPFNPTFAMALIRNMAKRWKSEADYLRMQEERDAARQARELAPTPDAQAKDDEIYTLKRELKRLNEGIDAFYLKSGVDLRGDLSSFQMGRIGEAVKVARNLLDHSQTGDLNSTVAKISTAASDFERHAHSLAETAVKLRALMPPEHTALCTKKQGWGGGCSCGVTAQSDIEKRLTIEQAEIGNAPDLSSIIDSVP